MLEDARQELADSLKEVRDFARNVHPAILSDPWPPSWAVTRRVLGVLVLLASVLAVAAAGRSPKDTDMHHNDARSSPVIWDEQLPDQQDSGGRCA